MDENWTHDMSIADLKDIVEEKTANLVANQRMFYAGVHLPDVLKLSPDWVKDRKVHTLFNTIHYYRIHETKLFWMSLSIRRRKWRQQS